MIMKCNYQQGSLHKDFYITYAANTRAYVQEDPKFLDILYPIWKQKFIDLNFVQLDEETFKNMFMSLLENMLYNSEEFCVKIESISV